MKNIKKRTVIKVVAILAAVALVLGGLYILSNGTIIINLVPPTTISRSIRMYDNWARFRCPILPSLDEVGDYEDYDYQYYSKSYIVYAFRSHTLKLKYSEEEFAEQKELLAEKYVYAEELREDHPKYTWPKSGSFELDGYSFKALDTEYYNFYYPQEFVFVGVSEEKNEIVYFFFDDTDIDCIDMSYEELLREHCNWK